MPLPSLAFWGISHESGWDRAALPGSKESLDKIPIVDHRSLENSVVKEWPSWGMSMLILKELICL